MPKSKDTPVQIFTDLEDRSYSKAEVESMLKATTESTFMGVDMANAKDESAIATGTVESHPLTVADIQEIYTNTLITVHAAISVLMESMCKFRNRPDASIASMAATQFSVETLESLLENFNSSFAQICNNYGGQVCDFSDESNLNLKFKVEDAPTPEEFEALGKHLDEESHKIKAEESLPLKDHNDLHDAYNNTMRQFDYNVSELYVLLATIINKNGLSTKDKLLMSLQQDSLTQLVNATGASLLSIFKSTEPFITPMSPIENKTE